MALVSYFFLLMANGRLWRYQGASRPAVFYSRAHAETVARRLGLAGARVVTQDSTDGWPATS